MITYIAEYAALGLAIANILIGHIDEILSLLFKSTYQGYGNRVSFLC